MLLSRCPKIASWMILMSSKGANSKSGLTEVKAMVVGAVTCIRLRHTFVNNSALAYIGVGIVDGTYCMYC